MDAISSNVVSNTAAPSVSVVSEEGPARYMSDEVKSGDSRIPAGRSLRERGVIITFVRNARLSEDQREKILNVTEFLRNARKNSEGMGKLKKPLKKIS